MAATYLFALAACSLPRHGEPGVAAGSRPVLVGTLVDGDGRSLPNESTTLNVWTDGALVGGLTVVSDNDGHFRIDSDGLEQFAIPSSKPRTIGLVGSEDRISFYDARRSLAPGLHDIGDLLFSHPGDSRALRQLGDAELLARLQIVSAAGPGSDGARDACLQEMARRGGTLMCDRLQRLEAELQEQQPESDTDTALITARNRAERMADPIELGLRHADPAGLQCQLSDLPTVSFALVNRDPKGRLLRFHLKPQSRNEDLAVDCVGPDGAGASFDLIQTGGSGLRMLGQSSEIAPGEAAAVEVPLSSCLIIKSPGRYRIRLAFRTDTREMVDGTYTPDGWKSLNRLIRGAIFVYSPWITLDVHDDN